MPTVVRTLFGVPFKTRMIEKIKACSNINLLISEVEREQEKQTFGNIRSCAWCGVTYRQYDSSFCSSECYHEFGLLKEMKEKVKAICDTIDLTKEEAEEKWVVCADEVLRCTEQEAKDRCFNLAKENLGKSFKWAAVKGEMKAEVKVELVL